MKYNREEIKKKQQQWNRIRFRSVQKQIAKKKKHKVVRKKKKKRNPNSVPSLLKKLTKVFNLYIRRRDCILTTKNKDFGKCVTCGRVFPFSKLDAGHFIASTYSIYRFDERNVHAQCRRDNRFLHGALIPYTIAMINMYGKDVVDEMERNKHKIKKWNPDELKKLIKTYNKKLNELL